MVSDRLRLALAVSLVIVAVLALAITLSPAPAPPGGTPRTPTPEPLIPTLPPSRAISPPPAPAPADQATGKEAVQATVTVSKTTPTPLFAPPAGLRSRLGVGVPLRDDLPPLDEDMARRLGFGWYLNWQVEAQPLALAGLTFAQMVRVRDGRYRPDQARVIEALTANPGALWLIGNEPDVPWQDNTTPEDYAALYHQLYTLIKTHDPSARVAIGGVSQPTPLRLLYLERVMEAYESRYDQPLPVDAWNVHAFILREEQDSWGVSIPPGFDVGQGVLFEIEDHDDLDLFRQQIIDFRRWMARRGQRDKPLIVSEYGILMPEAYGFPPERVAEFMQATFDFFLNARHPEIGYPADDNRLVQRFVWYSLSDRVYPTGNLVNPDSGRITPLGQAFAEYAAHLDASSASGE